MGRDSVRVQMQWSGTSIVLEFDHSQVDHPADTATTAAELALIGSLHIDLGAGRHIHCSPALAHSLHVLAAEGNCTDLGVAGIRCAVVAARSLVDAALREPVECTELEEVRGRQYADHRPCLRLKVLPFRGMKCCDHNPHVLTWVDEDRLDDRSQTQITRRIVHLEGIRSESEYEDSAGRSCVVQSRHCRGVANVRCRVGSRVVQRTETCQRYTMR